MHIRGHLTPFSQSLANQGMQQTYQNMNQVPLQNYSNFVGGSMNLGMQPYQSSGNMMPNNNIMDYMADPEPTPDYIEEPDFQPGPLPAVPDFTNPVFPDFSNIIPGQFDLGFLDTKPDVLPPDFTNDNTLPNPNPPIPEPEIIPAPGLPDFSQPVFPGFGNIIPGDFDLGLQPYDPDSSYTDEQIEQFEENLANMLATSQAPQFTGGGGQGGQAARRLYFPGTSGGFSSVGTGIGGGGTTLDDLLRRMR